MHSLRGALAVAMIGAGTPIPVVSAVLGHACSDTTPPALRFDVERCYSDGSITKEAVEGFRYARHLSSSALEKRSTHDPEAHTTYLSMHLGHTNPEDTWYYFHLVADFHPDLAPSRTPTSSRFCRRRAMASDDFFGLVRAWLTVHLPSSRRLSPHTIRSYKTALNTLLTYLRQTRGLDLTAISFQALDHAAISGSTLWLLETQHLSASSANQRLAAIKSFL